MSSKMVSKKIVAVYFDPDEEITYVFTKDSEDKLEGFRAESSLTPLDNPKDILDEIAQIQKEKLNQLKSIEEASNAEKTRNPGEAPGAPARSGSDQKQ